MSQKKSGDGFAVKDRRSGFAIIDNILIDDYGPLIGAYGIAAYCILVRFARADGTDSYPSYQKVADLMGASRSTAIRAIKRLIELRLIEKEKRSINGESLSNTYALVDITKLQVLQVVGSVPQELPSVTQLLGSVSQEPGGVPRTPDQDTITKHHNKNKQGEGSKIAAAPPTPPPAAPVNGVRKMGNNEYNHPITANAPSPSVSAVPPSRPLIDGHKWKKGGGYIIKGLGETPTEIWYESFSIKDDSTRLTEPDEDDLKGCVDLAKFREVVTTFRQCNFPNKKNIRLILDWYRDGIPDRYLRKEVTNGANHSRGSAQRSHQPIAPENYTAPAIQFYTDPDDPY